MMASVIMTDTEETKAKSFFECWKRKYTVNPNTSFHTTDFFEDHIYEKGKLKGQSIIYRKPRLNKFKPFEKTVYELVNLIQYLKFKSNVYYIDLFEVQKKLGLNKKYSKIIKHIINQDYGGECLYPIFTASKFLYKDHEKQLVTKRGNKSGFVCYESQKENDMKIIQAFYENIQKMRKTSSVYIYGQNVLGINFYNKASLCSGIEIADFIAYSTNQELRNKNAKNELKNFDIDRLKLLLKVFDKVKKHFRIKVHDVTQESVDDFKALKTRIEEKRVKRKANRMARKTKKASKS
jgi:ribosome recycling factor